MTKEVSKENKAYSTVMSRVFLLTVITLSAILVPILFITIMAFENLARGVWELQWWTLLLIFTIPPIIFLLTGIWVFREERRGYSLVRLLAIVTVPLSIMALATGVGVLMLALQVIMFYNATKWLNTHS